MATNNPPAARRVLTEEARTDLFNLVKAAEEGEATVIIRGDAAAVLAPLARLEATWQDRQPPIAATPVTLARKNLGDLITAASTGTAHILTRNRRPSAVLLPVDADDVVPLGGTSGQTPPATGSPVGRQRLTALADVLTSDTAHRSKALSTGIPSLDRATGGLLPGRLVLVAAAQNVGGSLLALSAARSVAVTTARSVLYIASGLRASDVGDRLVSGSASVDYQRLRSGMLAPDEAARVNEARAALTADAGLYIDDGADVTTDIIRGSATDIPDLALVVVDRLQWQAKSIPLSGAEASIAAVHNLDTLARDLGLPVLCIIDTDDANALTQINAPQTWLLTRTGAQATLRILDRDLGPVGTVPLLAEMPYARFTDAPAQPTPLPAPATAATAKPRPTVTVTSTPPDHAGADAGGDSARRVSPHEKHGDLRDMLDLRVDNALREADGDVDAAIALLAKSSIDDGMAIFMRSRVGARYDPRMHGERYTFLTKPNPKGSDMVWEGRPKWTNRELLAAIRNGDRDEIQVSALDINAAYLSALKAHLPIHKLERCDTQQFDRRKSGIYVATPPEWRRTDLPNPIGDREEEGPLHLTDATMRLLLRCAELGLCEAPEIHEAWLAKESETLLDNFRQTLADARAQAIRAGGEGRHEVMVESLKDMYAKFVSTMGESSSNRDIHRVDWMHIIRSQAFANIWYKAHKAHTAGLVVVKMFGTDELHLSGDWRNALDPKTGVNIFKEGRMLNEIKEKDHYTIGRAA